MFTKSGLFYELRLLQVCIIMQFIPVIMTAQQLMLNGKPVRLDIRKAGNHSIRITIKPLDFAPDFPYSPALTERQFGPAALSLTKLEVPISRSIGALKVELSPSPLSIRVRDHKGITIQYIKFTAGGNLQFDTGDPPLLGLGEGGSKPGPAVNWRELPVEFDRRGILDSMEPRWQSDAYGSRNPVPLIVGTGGWAIFVTSPWVEVDLRAKDHGLFIPWQPNPDDSIPQNERNQGLARGKGLPPVSSYVPGLFDFFVFDAGDPSWFLQDFSALTGPAVLPPRWALGYMQSHRTLEDDRQMTGIIDSFRAKRIPLDAVIYLGTGFTPRGWNKQQPSFEFNPAVFKRDPKEVISYMHNRNVKIVLHMVPWDRDRLPGLQGTIPPLPGETIDDSHISRYWKEHIALVETGVDAFWPDEGDWFNLFERIKRHQLYYQGSLSTRPGLRPWSLQRNGFPGIARWGGWVWSGDTEASWKTLEAQIAVGINYSLSIGPYWGSDIGGFYANVERTGELYARWFQFGSFCGLFRAHGRTWKTVLPWGWGLNDMGPREMNNQNNGNGTGGVLQSEMNNPAIEPIVKKYDELRYQLMPYTYTLAWEARNRGMPLMRALWIHYPHDIKATSTGNQYLWGRDLLIAPVFTKAASSREVYLPAGDWYDWWTGIKIKGGQTVRKAVNLEVMPIYVRAGAIIPFAPVRQYTGEKINKPDTIKIFPGADGEFTLYEDDGISMKYLQGRYTLTRITWEDRQSKLVIEPLTGNTGKQKQPGRKFVIELVPAGKKKEVVYTGKRLVQIIR